MRACGGRGNRRKLALRVFHLSGRRLLSLLFGLPRRGVVVACLSYKSGRRWLCFFPLRHKALASCSFFCLHLLHFRRADTPLPPKAMAGVEAWPPSNVTKSALEARVRARILRPLKDIGFPEWIVPSANDREPNPPPGYVVCFLSCLDRGFGVPA